MSQRETMEVDVLFVGGGVASLSGAIHLMNLIAARNAQVEAKGQGRKFDEPMIAVLEKGPYLGAHNLSGAIMDPRALKELIPDFAAQSAPLEAQVSQEEVVLLTRSGKIKAPIVPPPLNNHGHYVVSLAKLTEWLGARAEARGVNIFPGFAGVEILYDGDKVAGVATGDKGLDQQGNPKANFEPGIELRAKVTVFGEGTRGNLAKSLIKKLDLDRGRNPQTYVVGIKEVWEVPAGRIKPGQVIHTLGFPLKNDTYGGGFVYGLADNRVSLGLMVGLDYADPHLDPHREFQKFKLHPYISWFLEGGAVVQYGAKTVPVGGYFAVPRLAFDGGLLIGDSAGVFISQKIKGLHTAMKSGMLAAEAAFEALVAEDCSEARLKKYPEALMASFVGQELRQARNFHQAFRRGLWLALASAGAQFVLGGRDILLKDRLGAEPDFGHLKAVAQVYGTSAPSDEQKGQIKFDGQRTFDKETDVFHSGASHEEQQPCHLQVKDLNLCLTTCAEKFQNPCQRFCPASVYQIVEDEATGQKRLSINFSNCLHCKTCDVKDPFENIAWVPPEGGGGPKYTVV